MTRFEQNDFTHYFEKTSAAVKSYCDANYAIKQNPLGPSTSIGYVAYVTDDGSFNLIHDLGQNASILNKNGIAAAYQNKVARESQESRVHEQAEQARWLALQLCFSEYSQCTAVRNGME